MTAYADETQNEKTLSGALTLVMHLLFLVLLVFGFTWQKREPAAVVAELWSNLPAPKAAPPPPKAEPERPKPQPKVEPKPVPKVEPKPVPKAEPKPAPKPDIALREKKEKELKAKERELAEKKKREEQARLEALKQQKAKEAEALRLAREQAEALRLAREQDEALRKLAQSQAAAQAQLVDEYKRRIADRIKRFIREPLSLQGNPEVEFDVIVLPGGEVLDVRIRKASGQAPWDNAVERAIRRAQPLPLPPDPALMREFRELNLRFRPKE